MSFILKKVNIQSAVVAAVIKSIRMSKKTVTSLLLGLAVVAVAAVGVISREPKAAGADQPTVGSQPSAAVEPIQPAAASAPVKEFTMTSFVEFADGKPKPQFSLKEITVKKGDLVRLKITVTKGMHDFKIDEYGVYADTQIDQEKVVEFLADKAGEFVYYCTKPGHRANGHWGTLKVVE